MKHIVLLCCLLYISINAQAGELYRWVDSRGKVHYGDIVPADASQVETRKYSDAVVPDGDLPYETRRAQQNFPVTLYVADNCTEYCDKARNLLEKRGIPFTEKALRTKEDVDAFKALAGFDSVPTLSIGKIFLRGLQADQWSSELDFAGYPKTAPYRAPKKPVAPVVPPTAAPAAPSTVPAAASEVPPTDTAAP